MVKSPLIPIESEGRLDSLEPEDHLDSFIQRKQDHIEISLMKESQSSLDAFPFLELQHNPLPELDLGEVNLDTEVFNHSLGSPFFASSMTLGHPGSSALNELILRQCEKRGWMMGVGSQRRQLFDPVARKECRQLRRTFPRAIIFGNIGLSQVIEFSVDSIVALVDSLEAQFLVVHTNPLQEALQREGTPRFRGGLGALSKLCSQSGVPVVLKETGCGFSRRSFDSLKNVGLAALDVSGRGGTHWGRVEGLRQDPADRGYQVAETFGEWGISTLDSLMNAVESGFSGSIWASGGVRSGLDGAKLLTLGAEKVGFAQPLLVRALEGEGALGQFMDRLDFELKLAMFCLGVGDVASLVGRRDLYRWKRRPSS